MQNLISRWNREKEEAVERARVFDVEERDGCLILSRRRATVMKRTLPTFGVALFSIVWGWRIYEESPVFDVNWLGVTMPIAIGLTMMLVPMWEIWHAYRGDVWIFNSQTQQIKHNGLLIMSLKSLEKVEVHRFIDSENPDYFRLSIGGKREQFEVLDEHGLDSEYVEVGQRLAHFAEVDFIDHRVTKSDTKTPRFS